MQTFWYEIWDENFEEKWRTKMLSWNNSLSHFYTNNSYNSIFSRTQREQVEVRSRYFQPVCLFMWVFQTLKRLSFIKLNSFFFGFLLTTPRTHWKSFLHIFGFHIQKWKYFEHETTRHVDMKIFSVWERGRERLKRKSLLFYEKISIFTIKISMASFSFKT